MLSCPTGGGHGRSLITLISTASVFPASPWKRWRGRKASRGTDVQRQEGDDRKQSTRENRKERVSETLAEDASIVIQSRFDPRISRSCELEKEKNATGLEKK